MIDFSGAEHFIIEKLRHDLSKELTYHSFNHTMDVLDSALNIAKEENISNDEVKLLRIGVLLHDSGFLFTYKNHEEKSCAWAKEILTPFGFDEITIEKICALIMATKIPQKPNSILEKIIGDADLDYLGREDYYPIANNLFKELISFGLININEWHKIQYSFLCDHTYHTSYSSNNREEIKQKRITELAKLI